MPKIIDPKIKMRAEALRKKGKTIREVFDALKGAMSMGSIQGIEAGYHYSKRSVRRDIAKKAKTKKQIAVNVAKAAHVRAPKKPVRAKRPSAAKAAPRPKVESGDASVPVAPPECADTCPVVEPVAVESGPVEIPAHLETNIG